MIVVDVNVIAYLFIEGEHTRDADQVLRKDPEWAAPLLWRSEWRSVLSGYLRRRELDLPAAIERMRAAERLIRTREYLVDDALVLQMVARSSCSAHDCAYAALAESLDVPLVTNGCALLADFPLRAVSPRKYLS